MPAPILFLIHITFFMILSEQINWETAVMGTLTVLLSQLLLIQPRRRSSLRLSQLFPLAVYWLTFFGILLREIVLANIQVARIVLNPRLSVAPRVCTYTTELKSPALLAVFATAITLTPGTMTVDISESTLQIHCLTEDYASSLHMNPTEPVLLQIQEVLHG